MFSVSAKIEILNNWLLSLLTGKYWVYKCLLIAFMISVFSLSFTFGYYFMIKDHLNQIANNIWNPTWEMILEQSKNPLKIHTLPAHSHEYNRTFRLTIPLILKLFNIKSITVFYLLEVVAGLTMAIVVAKRVSEILADKINTLYFMIGFCSIYLGASFIINPYHCDAYSYSFFALCFVVRNPYLLFGLMQLAFWCDERVVINSFYIPLWYLFALLNNKLWNIKIKQIPNQVFVYVLAIMCYYIVRKYLEIRYGLTIVNVYSELYGFLRSNIVWTGYKFYQALEGMWLIIFVFVWSLFSDNKLNNDYQRAIIITLSLGLSIIVGFLILDVTRSISFCFPIFFIALRHLKEKMVPVELRWVLLVSMFFSVLFPIFFP